MIKKVNLKITCYIFVNIVLFILYVWFFGMQSIQKYFDNGVTIISHEEKPPAITPPGQLLELRKWFQNPLLHASSVSASYLGIIHRLLVGNFRFYKTFRTKMSLFMLFWGSRRIILPQKRPWMIFNNLYYIFCILLAADSSSICPNVVVCLSVVCLSSSWKMLANCLLTAC